MKNSKLRRTGKRRSESLGAIETQTQRQPTLKYLLQATEIFHFPTGGRGSHQCPGTSQLEKIAWFRTNNDQGGEEEWNKSSEKLKWSKLEVDFDLSYVDVTECALEQEVVNNQQILFNCFVKIPVSRYDIMCWLTKKNVQSTATHADRIAVFTARICWVFTWAPLMSCWW